MIDPISYGGSSVAQAKYGQAAKYDFDNPAKWHTEASVPLLDEHEMTNEAGEPVAAVDKIILEQIANNNNKRVRETGDPATLILGHTSDDPRAPEKPAYGFVVNYSVRPFKRDPRTGQVIYAIHGDYKVRHKHKELLEQYPRRSVELWWHKKELDPIAMLGGSSPERDLGVVIRNGRINHVSIDVVSRRQVSANDTPPSMSDAPIRFSTRGNYTIESYSIEAPLRYNCGPGAKSPKKYEEGEEEPSDEDEYSPEDLARMRGRQSAHDQELARRKAEQDRDRAALEERRGKRKPPQGYKFASEDHSMGPQRYEDDLMNTSEVDDHDPGDEGIPGEGEGPDSAESDPVLAKLFQSKQWKEMSSKIDQLFAALTGPEGGPGEPGMGGEEAPPGEMPPPGAGPGTPGMEGMEGMDAPGGEPPMGMDAPGGEPPMGSPDEEARGFHGNKPVKMNSTAFPGATDSYIPQFNGRKQMTRTPTQRRGGVPTRQPQSSSPEVVKLQRQLHDNQKQLHEMRLRYARSEAEKIISGLVNEHLILFGRTPEDHEKGMREQKEYFTHLLMQEGGEADVKYEVEEVILKRYERKRPNPASPASVGVARFARAQAGSPGGEDADENFEEKLAEIGGFEAVTAFADLQGDHRGPRKMSRKDAISHMRKKYGRIA